MKNKLLSFISIITILILLTACGNKTFSVEFDLNGGVSSSLIETQKIKEGGLVTEPEEPVKEGHDFISWTFNDKDWGFSSNKVSKDITLTAKWALKEYTVTFNTKGFAPEPEVQIVKYGEKASIPANLDALEGNAFLGWYLYNEEFDFDTPIKENLVITPKWESIFIVTINTSEENVLPTHHIFEAGQYITEPAITLKEDHIFDGWQYFDGKNHHVWDFEDEVTFDVEIVAVWLTHEQYVYKDFDAITLEVVDGEITLPPTGPVSGIKISWASMSQRYVTNKGVVNPPSKGHGPQEVILTASAVYEGETYSKDIIVIIEPRTEALVTSEKELTFTNLTNEYEVLDSEILTYFVDEGNLPYLDVESFMMLLEGLLYSEELEFVKNDHILEISYEVTDEDDDETYYFELIINFDEGTIYAEEMSFFSHYIKSTSTDYSEGINYLDTYVEEGNSVTFYLFDYDVDMIVYEEGDEVYYLMPYNFLSMIMLSESYYNFYYNGDGFYGFYAIPSRGDKTDEYKTFETIKTSSLNNTQMHEDIAISSFNQTAFIFDHYFGLRGDERYGVEDSFYEILDTNYNNYLSDTGTFNKTLRSFINKRLDELHSSYHFPGYYNRVTLNYSLTINDLGPKTLSWYEDGLWVVQDSIERFHPAGREGFKFLNNDTAVIYLDGFDTASVDEEKSFENDSDAFMKKTLDEIYEINPNVKYIGIDLSYNIGGNIGALFRVLGYITEKPIEVSYHDPLTLQNLTYFIELDQEAYEDVNWFFITSPVTFSAANLMTAIVKNQNLGPIFGSTTGGGAASITPFVLADGTMISISSNNLLSIRTTRYDGTYRFKDVEDGIEPDLYLAPIDTQNTDSILDLINEYYK